MTKFLKEKNFDQKMFGNASFIEKGKHEIELELNLSEEIETEDLLQKIYESFEIKEFKRMIEKVRLF